MPGPSRHKRIGSSQRGLFLAKIQEAIDERLHRAEEDNLKFICDYDLEAVLKANANTLFHLEDWTPRQAEQVLQNCYHVLGTLIAIGAYSQDLSIRDLFFRHGKSILSAPKITDVQLLHHPQHDPKFSDFLAGLPYALKNQFLQTRYVMKPHKLEEQNPNRTVTLDPRERLPFSEEVSGIGVGGYSNVASVSVPPEYFITDGKAIYKNTTVYAVKRVTASEDFLKEVATNQILKESLTTHHSILKHHLSFIHGKSFNILLPLAEHGNLEVLLNEGFDPVYEIQRYNLHEELPNLDIGSDRSFSDIINQFTAIAGAVEWLHSGISIKQAANVYLVHMDLKPDNILITKDPTRSSSVGVWVLSDFGISVIKEGKPEPQKSNFLTVGDAYHQFESRHSFDKSQTKARRAQGTYQAPEVEGDGKAGRKSDVWSLACIFSEIINFGIGGKSLVQTFRESRSQKRRGHLEDMFYCEKEGMGTWQQYKPERFEIRLAVKTWFEEIMSHRSEHTKSMKNCANIVLSTLVVDSTKRPECAVFRGWIEKADVTREARDRMNSFSESQGRPALPATPEPSTLVFPYAPPQSRRGSGNPASPGNPGARTNHSPASSISRPERLTKPLPRVPPSPQQQVGMNLTQTRSPSTSDSTSITNPGLQNTSSLQRYQSYSSDVDLQHANVGQALDVSICPLGQRIVWLTKDQTSQYIVFASISTNSGTLVRQNVVRLPDDACWEHVEIAGLYTGVFGHEEPYKNQKRVCFFNVENGGQPNKVHDDTCASLADKIAISSLGIGVLREWKVLRLIELDTNRLVGPMNNGELSSSESLTFSAMAFSALGNVLVAWCYGRGVEEIYCWRFDDQRTRTFASYRLSMAKGDPGIDAIFVSRSRDIEMPLEVVFRRHGTFYTAKLDEALIKVQSSAKLASNVLVEFCDRGVLFTIKAESALFKKKKQYQLLGYKVPFGPPEKPARPFLIEDLKVEGQPQRIRATVVEGAIIVSVPLLDGGFKRVEYRWV